MERIQMPFCHENAYLEKKRHQNLSLPYKFNIYISSMKRKPQTWTKLWMTSWEECYEPAKMLYEITFEIFFS